VTAGGVSKGVRDRVTGDLFTRSAPTPDPLADLDPPDPGPTRKLADYKSGDTYNLVPGSYKGPLKFDDNDEVNMEPGIYYISDGGLQLKENASLNAVGVMIY